MSTNNKKIFSEIGSTIGKIAEQMDPFLAGFYGADKDENTSIMIKSEDQHKSTSMPIGGDIKTEEDMNLFMSGMRSEAQKNADRQASARARYSARPEVRQGLIDYNEAQLKEKGRQGTYERIYAEEYKKDPEKAVINAMMAVDNDKSIKAEEERLKNRIKELKTAADIEQTGRKLAHHESVRASEEARERGEMNPALVGLLHGDEVEAKFNELAQETRDNTYHYARNREIAKREEIMKNPDFSKFVAWGEAEMPQIDFVEENRLGKELVNFINDPVYKLSYAVGNNDKRDASRFLKLTDKEKDIIRAYASMNDYATVEDYYKLLERDLNARVQNEKNEKSRDFSHEHPLLAGIGNVASSFLTAPAYLENARQAIENGIKGEYEPTDINSPAFALTHFGEQSEEGIGDWAYGIAGGGKTGEAAEILAKDGVSIMRDASKIPLGGWGIPFTALDGASGTTYDALERGEKPGKALWEASKKGALSAVADKFEIPPIVETVLEEIILENDGEYQSKLREFQKKGMTKEDAAKKAGEATFGKTVWEEIVEKAIEKLKKQKVR